MTDNPVERGIERAWVEYQGAVDRLGTWHDSAWMDAVRKERDRLRTAILKHDPDVRALADILGRLAEDERPCDEISVHFDDKTYCLTHGGQWPCMWQAAKEALEAYRTAVSDGERPQD